MRALLLGLCAALLGCGEVAGTVVDAATDAPGFDAGADVDAAIDCAGLDALTCRNRAGCAADFCDSCTCTPTYVGCRAVAAPTAECPLLDCPTPACCRDQADCTNAACTTPDDPPRCGICRDVTSECATDQDCNNGVGAAVIGAPVACACSPANACVPGCADDTACAEAETCDVPTGHCRPQACSVTAPCPADFDCGAAGCTRRACTTDASCDGFCVEGACRGSLGACEQLPG